MVMVADRSTLPISAPSSGTLVGFRCVTVTVTFPPLVRVLTPSGRSSVLEATAR